VKSSGGTWIIVSAVNQATSALLLMNLTRDIGLGFAGLAVLFGFASWLMTSTALRPVARLRRSAELLVESGSTEMLEVGPARDEVTELAQTLNDLILDLRAAAEREKHMVSDASHELRTPLAILQSQLELIRTGDKSTLSSDLAAAEMAAHRMGTLVSNLLELSRLEASPQIGIATVRELAEELVEAVDRARLAAAKTDIIVDFELPQAEDALAERVAISAHNFGRVVGNLVINAIKAMASAGGTGTVQATLTVASGQATLVVADTGPGITESYLPRAFDRFSHDEDAGAGVPTMASGSDRMGVSSGSAALAGSAGAAGLAGSREHGGTAEPGQPGRVSQPVGVGRPGQVGQPVGGAQLVGSGGTGLGLSIVAAIVKASHGTITLSNIPGAGLSAVVVLATIPHGG
jgi:signal transduction histidine kinase